MSLGDFLRKSRRTLADEGIGGVPAVAADFTASALARVPYVSRIGTNVYDREWDVLVVLDACRVDLYRETIDPDADGIWSVGSSSEEWMRNTFGGVDTSETAYVTGNVFSDDELSPSAFHTLEEVWRYAWDDELGTIPPRPVTNEAVRIAREQEPDRLIVHYMQPHFPAIGSDRNLGGEIALDEFGGVGRDFWPRMRRGETDTTEAWAAYRENLAYVFEEVRLLLTNVSGTVAITADHGNAFGDWGLYGHPAGMQTPHLRRVPWDVRECTDEETFQPERLTKGNVNESDIEDRLADLGYA